MHPPPRQLVALALALAPVPRHLVATAQALRLRPRGGCG